MATPIDFIRLDARYSPREILEEDFPELKPFPISGGWGYGVADACVIDANDPRIDPAAFDGIEVEYDFIERRLYEELIIFRPEGERHAGIRHWPKLQTLKLLDHGAFDYITVNVEAYLETDFSALKAEWEGPEGRRYPDFDKEAHHRKRESLKRTGVVAYWFNVTSFLVKR